MHRLASLALLLASPAVAGPWTQDRGQFYVKVGESLFLSDAFRDARGQLQTGVDYVGWTTAAYFEVGLLEGLHVQAYIPHTAAANTYDNGNRYLSAGGGDLVFGLQGSLPHIELPHALRVTLKSPMYRVTDIQGAEAELFPLRGDGQIDTTVWLSVGDSIPDTTLYGFVEAGHQFRSERFTGPGNGVEYNDSLVGFAQFGGEIAGGFLLMANSSLVMPYGDDEFTKGYLTVGPAIYWPIGDAGFALEAGYDPIVWAVNSAEGYSVSIGVSVVQR